MSLSRSVWMEQMEGLVFWRLAFGAGSASVREPCPHSPAFGISHPMIQ